MKLTTKQLTLCAVLTAMALALSYLENLFPLSLSIPLPGIKLGLANIVTVFALYALGPGQALLILVGRCLLGAVFAGNMNALIFSVLGGVSAMLVMILLSRPGRLSVYGVSVGGAAAHNCGQIAAAVLTLGSTAPLAYLPVLLAALLFCLPLTQWCKNHLESWVAQDGRGQGRQALVSIGTAMMNVALLLVCTALLVGDSYNPFLYFRF